MSFQNAPQPRCTDCKGDVELRIDAKEKDLGELVVRRVLPSAKRRMVGPFIFFDHMGPANFPPGKGINVRPHPHIGLATITYLFDGKIMHRDSLGYEQAIEAGAVNLMTAGKGIVHSERAGDDLDQHSSLHGIQTWMALPDDQQEIEPSFLHYAAADLPEFAVQGVQVRLIMGAAYGHESPVRAYSPTLYMACHLPKGSKFPVAKAANERGVYVVDGEVNIGEDTFQAGALAVLAEGREIIVTATKKTTLMVFGGAALGARHIWWNFVSVSKERIEQAKQDWKDGNFGSVAGDDEFIPLPDK
jgi:redox-sensitive bicupin YhaK (pirin superfamily)